MSTVARMIPALLVLGLAFGAGYVVGSDAAQEADVVATWPPVPKAKPLPEMLRSND